MNKKKDWKDRLRVVARLGASLALAAWGGCSVANPAQCGGGCYDPFAYCLISDNPAKVADVCLSGDCDPASGVVDNNTPLGSSGFVRQCNPGDVCRAVPGGKPPYSGRCVEAPTPTPDLATPSPPRVDRDNCIVTDIAAEDGRPIGPRTGAEGQPSGCDANERLPKPLRQGKAGERCRLPAAPPVPPDRWGQDSNESCEQGVCQTGICR